MARNENVIVLGGGLEQRTNQNTGRQRFSVQIKPDPKGPIAINLDPVTLGKPVAEAIAHHLREKMKSIAASASPATIRAREAAKRALQRGEQWAMKRYGGGRIGTREPGQSTSLFNDSGRFADSIVARASKDGVWRINVAGNRLDPQTANGGTAGVLKIWTRLVELVPEFADMNALMAASDVVRARIKAQEKMFKKGTLKAVFDLANAAIDTFETAAGMFG